MANPQLENGYTKIANEILDKLIETHLSPNQMKVFLFIIRKTYGWKKKSDFISLDQFVAGTGLLKPNVCRALSELITRNMIIKTDNKTYGIQKDWEKWKIIKTDNIINTDNIIINSDNIIINIDKKNSSKQRTDKRCQTPKETKYKRNLIQNKYIYTLFDFWNSLNIVKHRKITAKIKKSINARLKDFSVDEIKEAMQNYAKILHSKDYFLSYKWRITEFLSRDEGGLVEKFLTRNDPFSSYKQSRKAKPNSPQERDGSWLVLQSAKRDLEVSSSEDRILHWLRKLPPGLHGYLCSHLNKIYPDGHSFDKAKIRYEREKEVIK